MSRSAAEPARRTASLLTVIGLVAFAATAVWLVPWQPVPGGMPVPVPARELFTPGQVRRAESYAAWAQGWGWAGVLTSLVVGVLLVRSAYPGRRLRSLLDRVPGPAFLRPALVAAALTLVVWLCGLPFGLAGWRLRRDVGLSVQPLGAYLQDQVVWQLLQAGVTALLVLILGVVVRRLPRVWPAAVGVLLAGFVAVASFGWPLVVEPLFNDFRSLRGPLRAEILQLADREGVPVDDVLVADASVRTTRLNAYVSGFGSSRRVVLYDTLVDTRPPREVLAVAAHELAHARHADPLVGTVLGAMGSLVGAGLLGVVLTLPGVRRRWGPPDSAAVVPLLLLLVAAGSLASAPVSSGISRQIETRADVDALRSTRDPVTFARMQRELALVNLADPTPPAWSQLWFGTHPTVLQRVAIARHLAR